LAAKIAVVATSLGSSAFLLSNNVSPGSGIMLNYIDYSLAFLVTLIPPLAHTLAVVFCTTALSVV
jgi:hypothetical protein